MIENRLIYCLSEMNTGRILWRRISFGRCAWLLGGVALLLGEPHKLKKEPTLKQLKIVLMWVLVMKFRLLIQLFAY